MEVELKELYSSVSGTVHGDFRCKIMVSAVPTEEDLVLDLDTNAVRNALSKAESLVKSAVCREMIIQSKAGQAETKANRSIPESVFPGHVYIEEIPNEYCGDWCCMHRPWFIVTTTRGKFKIGARKRVIQIEWDQIKDPPNAFELFEKEAVTKEANMIHAWSLDDAKLYVQAIMTGTPLKR